MPGGQVETREIEPPPIVKYYKKKLCWVG
ncbi:unnamed protein product [Aspergillus niger]|uniref:Contig An06c0090, genomic contig n=1 Tax=Aspergillus niger (strain ATCC MYA-4892 / CBS 513.88 / FGSC A1513) TaxID=425011 RepID=A2QLL6_ASPNC|nr:unnamed protein product [Aspergillus niger]